MVNGYKLVEKLSWYYKLWAKPKAFDKKCQMLKKTYQNYLLDEANPIKNYINKLSLQLCMSTTWEITKEAKLLPTLHNPLLIEGLPGIGNVGKIAVDFLVEELKAI